jgi:hypothetical protein
VIVAGEERAIGDGSGCNFLGRKVQSNEEPEVKRLLSMNANESERSSTYSSTPGQVSCMTATQSITAASDSLCRSPLIHIYLFRAVIYFIPRHGVVWILS